MTVHEVADVDDVDVSDQGFGDADLGVLEVVEPSANAVRLDALRTYHAALHAPALHDDDEQVVAAALVVLDDAREAYRAAGGSPGSRWSLSYADRFLDARELLGEDVSERREELAARREVPPDI